MTCWFPVPAMYLWSETGTYDLVVYCYAQSAFCPIRGGQFRVCHWLICGLTFKIKTKYGLKGRYDPVSTFLTMYGLKQVGMTWWSIAPAMYGLNQAGMS